MQGGSGEQGGARGGRSASGGGPQRRRHARLRGQNNGELAGADSGHAGKRGGAREVATGLNRRARWLGGDGELPRRRIEPDRRRGRELVAGEGRLASGWEWAEEEERSSVSLVRGLEAAGEGFL